MLKKGQEGWELNQSPSDRRSTALPLHHSHRLKKIIILSLKWLKYLVLNLKLFTQIRLETSNLKVRKELETSQFSPLVTHNAPLNSTQFHAAFKTV